MDDEPLSKRKHRRRKRSLARCPGPPRQGHRAVQLLRDAGHAAGRRHADLQEWIAGLHVLLRLPRHLPPAQPGRDIGIREEQVRTVSATGWPILSSFIGKGGLSSECSTVFSNADRQFSYESPTNSATLLY